MRSITWLHVLAAIGSFAVIGALSLFFDSFIAAILAFAVISGVVLLVERSGD